jgi:hypothetical protein
MQRCAHAGRRERHGSNEEGTGEAGECDANAKGEGTHRLTSHALRAGSGQRASALH